MEALRGRGPTERLWNALHDAAVATGFKARRANVVASPDRHAVARLVAMTHVQPAQCRHGILEPERVILGSCAPGALRADIGRVDVDGCDDRERRALAVF